VKFCLRKETQGHQLGSFYQVDDLGVVKDITIYKVNWRWEIYELEQWRACKPKNRGWRHKHFNEAMPPPSNCVGHSSQKLQVKAIQEWQGYILVFENEVPASKVEMSSF